MFDNIVNTFRSFPNSLNYRLCYCTCIIVLVLSTWQHNSHAQDNSKLLSPAEAAKATEIPHGFNVTLFAGEPDVVQPIAITTDDRGRLWVVECYSYPEWTTEKKDRVLIFEDSNGDGKFDKRTIFWDQGVNLSGIEVGFGGVWLCSVPNFIFIPDQNHDDKPDGPPQTLLDGWDLKARHNVFNGLTWGPDGWLYGLNGILSNSKVGKPGAADAERVDINCGVWRYQPTQHIFEAVAHGTTNPWGLDFDDHGQMFITNCVIKHLWHIVPGAHYERMFGQDMLPHSYELIESISDHYHWGGGNWTSSRVGVEKHDVAGGGHAHAGAMIYLGDNWPKEYRNNVFTLNIHGRRMNRDILQPHGSSYVGKHGADLMFSRDPWFRGLELKYGPDGSVYITDWNDTGECHDYINTQKGTGRIFKMTYGKPKHSPINLRKLTDDQLVELQKHDNDWYVQHARRLLQERAAAGTLSETVHKQLWKQFDTGATTPKQLRSLWALHVTGGLTEKDLVKILPHGSDFMRSWAIQLLVEGKGVSAATLTALVSLAKNDTSPHVRLYLASALQRLPMAHRWDLATALVSHADDKNDHYLPHMIWYGIETLVTTDSQRTTQLIANCQIPQIQKWIARRVPTDAGVYSRIASTQSINEATQLMQGLREAFIGQLSVNKPASWDTIAKKYTKHSDTKLQLLTKLLSLQFGLPDAPAQVRSIMMNPKVEIDDRTLCLQMLVHHKDQEAIPLLVELLNDANLAGDALNGLAALEHKETPIEVIHRFKRFSSENQTRAIGVLISRPDFALALLEAVDQKKIERNSVSAFAVRQLLSLSDPAVSKKVQESWGTIRQTDAAKKKQMAELTKQLTADAITNADPGRGRAIFTKNCASCHRMFGEGGKIGPELTGSQRKNVEYLVQNLVDPNAIVGRDFQMTLFITNAGRTISGIVAEENAQAVTIQTPTEKVVLPTADIDERNKSNLSMMPEGLLKTLSQQQILDLFAYLQSEQQVALQLK